MFNSFVDGLDVLYHHAKFWGGQTTCAGCRCENIVFLFVMLGLPVRGGQFEQVLCVDLWVDFDAVFTAFSAVIALSEALESSRTHC